MGRTTLLLPVFIHFPTKEKLGSEYPGKNLTAGDEGIKGACCSCRGPGISFQELGVVVHNHHVPQDWMPSVDTKLHGTDTYM